jgi:hypothetical protein
VSLALVYAACAVEASAPPLACADALVLGAEKPYIISP